MKNTQKSGRLEGIDALRGTAVLMMVFSHGLHWAYPGTAHDIALLFGSLSPGDLATPMFYLAAGLSLYYSLQSRLNKGVEPLGLQRWYSLRLGKLMVIGVFMSLTWGVLQAQATTLLLLVLFSMYIARVKDFDRARSFLPPLMALALATHFLITSTPLHPAAAKVFSGQFPLFAILFLNGLGFFIAPRLRLRSFSLRYILLGLLLAASGLLLGEHVTVLTRPGAPLPFLLLGIGVSMLLLAFFELGFIQRFFAFRFLTRVGKDSLFIYVFHYVAFFVPMYLVGGMGTFTAAGSFVFSGTMTALIIVTAWLRQGSKVTVYSLLDLLLAAIWSHILQPVMLRVNVIKEQYPSFLGTQVQRLDR